MQVRLNRIREPAFRAQRAPLVPFLVFRESPGACWITTAGSGFLLEFRDARQQTHENLPELLQQLFQLADFIFGADPNF